MTPMPICYQTFIPCLAAQKWSDARSLEDCLMAMDGYLVHLNYGDEGQQYYMTSESYSQGRGILKLHPTTDALVHLSEWVAIGLVLKKDFGTKTIYSWNWEA